MTTPQSITRANGIIAKPLEEDHWQKLTAFHNLALRYPIQVYHNNHKCVAASQTYYLLRPCGPCCARSWYTYWRYAPGNRGIGVRSRASPLSGSMLISEPSLYSLSLRQTLRLFLKFRREPLKGFAKSLHSQYPGRLADI